MKRAIRFQSVVFAVVALFAGSTYIALSGGCSQAAKSLPVGAQVPDFKLTDTGGKEHTLAQYKGKVVVLDFCSHKCPFSRGADPAFAGLVKKYAEKGVVFLGIDSHKDTPPAEITDYAKEHEFKWPILKDVDNAYADAVGASRTPEIYIVGKDGKLAYHGAFDNRSGPDGKPTEHYTDDAIAALVAGEDVAKKSTKAWGCTIKRK